MSKLM
jgi:hypothetical protein